MADRHIETDFLTSSKFLSLSPNFKFLYIYTYFLCEYDGTIRPEKEVWEARTGVKVDMEAFKEAFKDRIFISDDGDWLLFIDYFRAHYSIEKPKDPIRLNAIKKLKNKKLLSLLPLDVYIAESDDVHVTSRTERERRKKKGERIKDKESTRENDVTSFLAVTGKLTEYIKMTAEELMEVFMSKESLKWKERIKTESMSSVMDKVTSPEDFIFLAFHYGDDMHNRIRQQIVMRFPAGIAELWDSALLRVDAYKYDKKMGQDIKKQKAVPEETSGYNEYGRKAYLKMLDGEGWHAGTIEKAKREFGSDYYYLITEHVVKIRPDLDKLLEKLFRREDNGDGKDYEGDFALGNFLTDVG